MNLLAQGPDLDAIQSGAGIKAPSDLGELISVALPYVFYISGFLLLIYMVLGGFQLMTSRGDPKAIQSAQAKITSALIGFVIILLSAGIVVILGKVLKVEVFSNIF
jgi:hypothetical protein